MFKGKNFFTMLKSCVAICLVVVMFAAMLAGCGSKQQSALITEDPDKVPTDTYEINWFIPASTQSDVDTVEAEINAYLKDKINATVNLTILETAHYKEKVSNMINSGEYFDLCFAANWMLSYDTNAASGAFMELDELAEVYMPKTLELSDSLALNAIKVNDTMYAIPTIKENATAYGWIYRKDIAEKYGIDMSTVKGYEDLMPIAKMIKEKEPSITYPVDWDMGTNPGAVMTSNGDFALVQGRHIGYDTNAQDVKIVNRLEKPEHIEAIKIAHEYYKAGLVKPDILTNNTDTIQRMRNGQVFCSWFGLKPGKAQEQFGDSDYEFAEAIITEPEKGNSAGKGSLMVISQSSKNPARVARFIELLCTDEYLYNLVVYGVEGKHYTKNDDGAVKVIDGSGYSLSGMQWMFGNVYNSYLLEGEAADKYVELKAFDDSAKIGGGKLAGISIDDEPIAAQLAAISTATAQYEGQILLGAIDPETVIPQYMAELEKNGIKDIIEYYQGVADEFLASK